MSQVQANQVDMARLFSSVATALKKNQESLNAADEFNHNHGDNMVKNFQVITRAMRATKGAPPSEQLAQASQTLSQRSQSGSAQLYAQGLAQAADRFQGKPAVTQADAMLLVQSLLGGEQAAQPQGQPSGSDLLGSLLGGQAAQSQGQAGGDDLLGGLLGALMGGGGTQSQPAPTAAGQSGGGIDMNTLLTAGMAFFQARQQGAAPVQALVQAVIAGSQMQSTTHHAQSGQIVATTLINTLGKMLSDKK